MFYLKRFKNSLDSSTPFDWLKILRWQFESLFSGKFLSKNRISFPTVNMREQLKSKEDFVCFLGHASILIQLNKKRILLDPVFGDIPFYKRITPFVYDIDALFPIDMVLISHLHYDHFDISSIKKIIPLNPLFITPLGMKNYLKKISKNLKVTELEWFESYKEDGVKIVLTPAKHWGARTPFDKNRALWGGFIIKSENFTIFFAGDSGYDKHFKEIGDKFQIDIALLPIGAYKPRYVMKNHHLNPLEAYQAFLDLKAKFFIPIHYGTFILSDEKPNEPIKELKKISDKNIIFLKHGEIFFIENSFSFSKI